MVKLWLELTTFISAAENLNNIGEYFRVVGIKLNSFQKWSHLGSSPRSSDQESDALPTAPFSLVRLIES